MSFGKAVTDKVKRFWNILGPGLVTGSSDDDPSGIATYSQAGAAFGLTTLWMALLTFPLMAAIQEMCARIGLITSHGITGTLKRHYSPLILYMMILFSFPAIVMNIGADIAAMGAVANLLFPGIHAAYFSVGFTAILLAAMIFLPYKKQAAVLKYLCLLLLVYLIVPFLSKQDWLAILKATVIPTVRFDKAFISILVAILGTTISPYLFFWQAIMEVEDRRQQKQLMISRHIFRNMTLDVNFGTFFSTLVMFFIILTTGTVLFNNGIRQIDSVEQAAKALEPLAGKASYLFFAIGIVGTGFLAIPILSGSLSYMVCETFGWKEGLDKNFHEAKAFYWVIIISLVVGLLINSFGISPIKALIYTAMLYGLTTPVLIGIVLHISNNKSVMGDFTNGLASNILGTATLLLTAFAAIVLLYLQFIG